MKFSENVCGKYFVLKGGVIIYTCVKYYLRFILQFPTHMYIYIYVLCLYDKLHRVKREGLNMVYLNLYQSFLV